MTDLFEPLDAHDPRLALRASGLLRAFNAAGVLTAGDVHVTRVLGELTGEDDESVLLAIALTCRAVRTGSVCLDLGTAAAGLAPLGGEGEAPDGGTDGPVDELVDLPWPDTDDWLAAVAGSRPVAEGVVRLDGPRLYLDRYHEQETQVLDDLVSRASTVPEHDPALLAASLARVFPLRPDGTDTYAEQRAACELAASSWTTVITGGPGTGKTTTVAGLLVALDEQYAARGHRARIALAAPTGKAAARLLEAVRDSARNVSPEDRARVEHVSTGTLHRLLRVDPGNSTRFRHHRTNRLPYDVVVVDEASMASLTMTARLLEAMRPDARLVLVGDPDQLASVDAGAVLGDLVQGYAGAPASPVAALVTTHRFKGGIARLAEALRSADPDAVVHALQHGDPLDPVEGHGLLPGNGLDVEWLRTHDEATTLEPATLAALHEVTLSTALEVHRHAAAGESVEALAALGDHRLLCAHRDGPAGVHTWNQRIQLWLTESGVNTFEQFHVGRPVLVTANDYGLGVHNGDWGVVVETPQGRRVLIDAVEGPRDFSPSRMGAVETMHAMTIHKSQGSQARAVTVLLPPQDSRLLTRELLYTAVTRARQKVRVVGSEAEVRAAVGRTARRASGLAERLQSRVARGSWAHAAGDAGTVSRSET